MVLSEINFLLKKGQAWISRSRTNQKHFWTYKRKRQSFPDGFWIISNIICHCVKKLPVWIKTRQYASWDLHEITFIGTWNPHKHTGSSPEGLSCTLFGEWKNPCSSKFMQLELLNKANARTWKKRASQGFH